MVGNQRWRERQDQYRPPRETIKPIEYDIASIPDDTTARQFVTEHHYSMTYPAARERFGLYRFGALVGVAVFSHPCNNRTLTNVFPALTARQALELGRFVLLDEVPGNGETWFLARCFEQLRTLGYGGVVSFSDPVPRHVEGRCVFPGHIGTIYQAFNGRYLGRGTARTLRLLPDGRVLSDRTIQKIRAGERGSTAAVAQLLGLGAQRMPSDADAPERRAWVQDCLTRFTQTLPHPGNHRYAWALNRRVPLKGLPYPKERHV